MFVDITNHTMPIFFEEDDKCRLISYILKTQYYKNCNLMHIYNTPI